MDDENALDPTKDWVREHLHRYVATDGANGHEWRGADAAAHHPRAAERQPAAHAPHLRALGQDYVVVGSQAAGRGTRGGSTTSSPIRR